MSLNINIDFDKILRYIILSGLIIFALTGIFSISAMDIGAGLALIFLIIYKLKNKDFKIKSSYYDKYIVIFLIVLFISYLYGLKYGDDPGSYLFRYIRPFLVYYIIIDYSPSLNKVKILFFSLNSAILITIIYNLVNEDTFKHHRFLETFNSHIMEYGTIIAFLFIASLLYFFWGNIKIKYKVILFINSFLAMITLINSRRRGVWLSTIFALIVLFAVKGKKYLVGFLVFIIIFTMISPYILEERTIDRFISIFELEKHRTRLNLYEGSLGILKDNIFLGTGLDSFENIINDYLPDDHRGSTVHAHNEILQFGVVAGLPGIFAFIVLYFNLLKRQINNYFFSKRKNYKYLYLTTFLIIIIYLFHGITEVMINHRFLNYFLWFIIALTEIVNKHELSLKGENK
ncbi:MAG: O-antigen ligase family protein [archaeon]